MLDIKLIKEKPEYVKQRLITRNADYSSEIDRIIEADVQRRSLITDTEQLRAKQNSVSKEIPKLKKEGKDTSEIFEEMRKLSDKVKADTDKIDDLDSEIESLLLSIPNLPDESVPIGPDDSANVEIRRWGEPRSFSFNPQPHWDVGAKLGILDPESATKVTGTRFHFYRGFGSKLERAVVNFYLDTHSEESGYTEIFPPFMVNRDFNAQVQGSFRNLKRMLSRLRVTDYFLIPTAEVPVTNMHKNDNSRRSEELPIKYCAYSACFRAEAGSAGRDTRGLIRQHQFNKVELVKVYRSGKILGGA